jgi:outer membrane receptor protein involved in Fe transport
MKLQGAYQRSLTVNQNRNMLLITTADVQIAPGFQFPFLENLDNANTYAHDSNLSYLKWTHSLNSSSFYEVQLSRLFTRMRADANGRFWRPESVDGEFDPESIVTFPVDVLNPDSDFFYSLPGSGFTNNGGLATLWHDHFAEEVTLKSSLTKFINGKNNRLTAGFEMKFQDYQWIDIIRPWVGAPIQISEGEFSQTSRLGSSSDVWRVKPRRGAIFVNDQIRYNGLIANLGVRMEYWAPGQYVDNFINDPRSPIPDVVREQYLQDTYKIGGLRYKFRLLPKLRVSFPVRENQVLFFNYGHSARVPHPSFVYAGLDPFYQDRSFLSNLGNPNLDPEMDISYEIGFRNQLSDNDALNVSAFWRDKYDFVTSQRVIVNDPTGRETERLFRVNGDYSRVRGVELTYLKRYKDLIQGQIAATYQRAEGLSSTNNDALRNILVGGQSVINNVETPLAFDRPWDIKGNITFTWDRKDGLFGIDPLNKFRLFMSATYRSGLRYTPLEFRGFERNPVTNEADWQPIYEIDPDPAKRFSEVGEGWFFVDLNFQKWMNVGDQKVTFFLEVTNLFNRLNPARINPVTGEGYRTDYPTDQQALIQLRDNRAYDVPSSERDPRFIDARDTGLPRYLDPANFLQQRHIVFGLSINFN